MADDDGGTGRPSGYDPAICQKVASLCANGATDEEVADHLEISVRTLYRWKNAHTEFCQALKAGKEIADDRVERSLYMKAVGFRQKAVKIFMPAGAEEPVYAEYMEHFSPDTTAAIFWLKNRRPDLWRDKQDHVVTGKDGGPVEIRRVIIDPKTDAGS